LQLGCLAFIENRPSANRRGAGFLHFLSSSSRIGGIRRIRGIRGSGGPAARANGNKRPYFAEKIVQKILTEIRDFIPIDFYKYFHFPGE